jgi:hypothetical protein
MKKTDDFSDAADAGVEVVQSKDEDPEFGEVGGGGANAGGSPFSMPSFGTDKIVDRVNQTIRKRNVPQTPATPMSDDDKQYDMDGDGILDENEKMLKNMYKEGDISAEDVYAKLAQLSAVKKKYASAKFFLLLAVIFCGFTIASNFAMSFVAMHISKELKVSPDGNIEGTGNDEEGRGALGTRSLGLKEKASLIDPGISGGSNGSNRNIRRLSFANASEQCTLEDYDPFFSEENLIGKLSMASCRKIWSQASSGTRPINIEVELNGNVYGHTLNDFRTVQNNGNECSFFNVFAGHSENWFFRGCGDECDFFITSNDKIPLPDCLDEPSIVPILKDESESCVKDRECHGDLQCMPISIGQGVDADGENKVCIDMYKSVKSRTLLAQEVFNHIGPLTDISKALFREIEKAGKLNDALPGLKESPADYAAKRALLVEEGDDEYQTLFVRESGCTRLRDRSDRCIPASELLALLNDNPLKKRFEFSKGSLSRSSLEAEYVEARKLDFSVVEKFGDICYGTFRGTMVSFVDWKTNVNLLEEDIETDMGKCTVRKGFNRAFWAESELWGEHPEEDYPDGMENAIRNCANTCGPDNDRPCTVVLSGHSQGGALATIAAILLHDLNPVVISFAAAQAIVPNTDGICPVLDKDRNFRIVSTRRSESGRLLYDPVPFARLGFIHVGHEIRLVDESASSTSAAYFYQKAAGVNLVTNTQISLHFLVRFTNSNGIIIIRSFYNSDSRNHMANRMISFLTDRVITQRF